MSNNIYFALIGLLILWAMEIRHRGVVEELKRLNEISVILDEAIQELRKQVRLKQDICENHNPPN